MALQEGRRLGNHYGKFEQWIFEPSVVKNTFQGYLDRAGIDVQYNFRVIEAHTDAGFIKKIELEKSSDPADDSPRTVGGKMLIDATYESSLLFFISSLITKTFCQSPYRLRYNIYPVSRNTGCT